MGEDSSTVDGKSRRARVVARNYTLLAMAAGAVPLPGVSAAIICINASMIGHIAAIYGREAISYEKVLGALGVAGLVNIGGRAMFVEILRFVASFGVQWWSLPLVCGVGSLTAGAQTWILGSVGTAVAESQRELTRDEVRKRVEEAKGTFGEIADADRRGERGKGDE